MRSDTGRMMPYAEKGRIASAIPETGAADVAANGGSGYGNGMGQPPRPMTVTEIMRDFMQVDVAVQIQRHMDRQPERLWMYERLNGASRYKVMNWRVLDSVIPASQWLGEIEITLLLAVGVSGNLQAGILSDEIPTGWERRIQSHQNSAGLANPTEAVVPVRTVRDEVGYVIQCTLDLRPCHQVCTKFALAAVEPGMMERLKDETGQYRLDALMKAGPDEMQANLYLVPIMRQSDYESVAREVLSVHYKEALTSAVSISGDELVKRMGLKLLEGRLRPEEQAMGFMYFTPTVVEMWTKETGTYSAVCVLPGTIVINTARCKTYEDRNGTLIHECMHMHLHKNFYMLQMVANPRWGFSAHRTRRRFEGGRLTPVDWSELQAQKLPAYILMPTDTAKPATEAFFAECEGRKDTGTVRRAIAYLSGLYKVSFSMAKYRMIELGFQEAEGIRAYIGDRAIPDHGCAGKWPEGCTFTISPQDAAELATWDASFAGAMESGRYLYVEGHFCLKEEKYLLRMKDRYVLTEYARNHINECCIAFHVSGRNGGASYRPEHAARNRKTPVTDKYHSRYEFVAEPGTEAQKKEFNDFYADAERWHSLLMQLPDTTYEAVNAVLGVKGISQMELALRLDVDRKTLYRYLEKESPELHHVVAVCVALQLPGFVGHELVRTARRRFGRTRKDHLLKIFLDSGSTMEIETCKMLYEEAGYGKLI